jgi:hypothetical protein
MDKSGFLTTTTLTGFMKPPPTYPSNVLSGAVSGPSARSVVVMASGSIPTPTPHIGLLTTIVEEAAIKMILTNTTSEMVAHREQNDRVSFTAVTWMAADPDPELLFQHEGAPLYTTEATMFLSNKLPHLAHPQSCPRLTLLMLSSLMIERDGFL